jgi:cytochrome c553
VIASAVSALWLLLVLACPLMMVFMMRGGHGHGHGQSAADTAGGCHGDHHGGGEDSIPEQPSLEELRQRLTELEAQIQALEAQEGERVPVAR